MNIPEVKTERQLRKTLISDKLKVYLKSMWSGSDLAIVLGVSKSTGYKYFDQAKEKIKLDGNRIEVHDKLPREKLIKFFDINLENDIRYFELIKEV